VRSHHQVETLLAAELRFVEVERGGKTEAAAFQSSDPDAYGDPGAAQVERAPRRYPQQIPRAW
jgi:hypothetical protein